jgi:hypothetical protein
LPSGSAAGRVNSKPVFKSLQRQLEAFVFYARRSIHPVIPFRVELNPFAKDSKFKAIDFKQLFF